MNKLIVLIIVSAFMILTIQTPLATTALAQSSEPECWAVIVGISDYQYINDLNYADDGARELYERLGPVWGEENIRLLLDEECTKTNIMAALDWLADRDNPDDTVLFYFSGHGDSGYIAPYNANYESTWIASDELDDRLDNLEAEKIVTILDTCYAGEFEGVLRDDGRLVLMSSRSTETTVETQTLENGVFTYFILVALEQFDDADTNHDYILSAEEVFQYAEQKTVSYTTPLLIEQHPVLSDSYPGGLGLLAKFIFGTNLDLRSVLTVDGEIIQSASPWFIWYPGSIHQIEVPSFVDEGDNTRLAFTSWDDSVTSTSRVVQSGAYTANYQRQYLLAIESAYGEPGGAGWYDEDSDATISIESIQELTVRRNFIGWSGDYTGNEETASFVMESPKTVKANWQSEYLLAIESAYGEPGGAGWYDEDSDATISIESIQEPSVRRNFTGWSGDYTGNEETVSFVMGSPKTVKANWQSEYLLTIESAYGEPGGAGWYDEGSTTTISVRESVGVLVRHLFTGWSGDVTSGAPTAMLVVDSPVKVTAEWRTDYTYLILLIVGVVVIIGILATTIIMLRRHSKKAV